MELASLGFLSLPVSFHFRTLFHSGKSSLAHLQRRGGPGLQVDGGHQRRGVRRQHRNKQNQRQVRKKKNESKLRLYVNVMKYFLLLISQKG